jgi:hypothetical protein
MDCCGIRQWPPIKLLCRRNAAARLKPQGEPRVLARLAGVRRRREFKRADSAYLGRSQPPKADLR